MLKINCTKKQCLESTSLEYLENLGDWNHKSIALSEIMTADKEIIPKQPVQTVNYVLVIFAVLPMIGITLKLYFFERGQALKYALGANENMTRESYFARQKEEKLLSHYQRDSWAEEIEENSRFSYAREDTISSYSSVNRNLPVY